jgi:hypothetical protein
VDVLTERLVTVNVALVAPDAMFTALGTVAAAVLLLVSVTVAPAAGAAADSVTVACAGLPPTTVAGLSVTELTTGASVIVSVAGAVTPP